MAIPWSRVTLRFGKQTECAFIEMQNARLMSQDQQVSAQQCGSLDNCCWLNMLCSIHLIQVKVPPPDAVACVMARCLLLCCCFSCLLAAVAMVLLAGSHHLPHDGG
jgi:hypothetical protein